MEEWILYFALAGGIAVVLVIIKLLTMSFGGREKKSNVQPQQERANIRPAHGNRRVAAAVRNRRAQARPIDDSDSDGVHEDAPASLTEATASEEALLNDPKLGAKKRAKLEAKIEKRAQRETEERQREEKKKRDAQEEVERNKKVQEEEETEKRMQAEEARRLEEARQREIEEYEKMKETFQVAEEGCDVINDEEEGNLLESFVNHIKAKKVILFEELATKFNLKVPEAIDRLNVLVENGRLTGVMDDRGKFIFISEKELRKFAKFIEQRGRVTVVDLVENSNQMINLTPEPSLIEMSS